MIRVIYDRAVYEGYAAAKSETDIWIYDENWNEINHIMGIYGDEWNYVSIENGTWTNLSDVPEPTIVIEEPSHEEFVTSNALVGYISGGSLLEGSIFIQNEVEMEEYPELIGTVSIPSHSGERYDGNYEITPTSNFHLLNTMDKYLDDDILVHPIPYSETSNSAGGYTATIGG